MLKLDAAFATDIDVAVEECSTFSSKGKERGEERGGEYLSFRLGRVHRLALTL